jgi:hypothetical protein
MTLVHRTPAWGLAAAIALSTLLAACSSGLFDPDVRDDRLKPAYVDVSVG